MSLDKNARNDLAGARVLILSGEFRGCEGVCLGKDAAMDRWSVSPDDTNRILSLTFEKDFGLLTDLSANPQLN